MRRRRFFVFQPLISQARSFQPGMGPGWLSPENAIEGLTIEGLTIAGLDPRSLLREGK
jgi:hypothetical protein